MDDETGAQPESQQVTSKAYQEENRTGQKVTHKQSTELAPAAPVSAHIKHNRAKNEIDLNLALRTGLSTGIGLGLIGSGSLALGFMSIPLFVIAVIYGIKMIAQRPKGIGAANTEYKSGDYSAITYWAPFLPALTWVIAFPLDLLGFESLPTPPVISSLFSGVFFGISGAIGLWAAWSQAYRVGKRRIKKITEKESLEGVTEARMNAVEENPDILGAMIAVGAVDGNETSVANLRQVLEWDKKDTWILQTRVKDLEQLGLLKVTGMALYKDPKHWQFTVTPDGIRNIAQLGKR